MTFDLATILEIAALTTSVVCVKFTKGNAFKWVCFILIITVINELLVVPYLGKNRNIAYNVFSLLDMFSFFMFFYCIFPTKIRLVVMGLFAVIVIYILEEVNQKGWQIILFDSRRAYDIIIILLSVYYLFTILKKEYHNLWTDNIFWICTGCIVYNAIEFIDFTLLANLSYWKLKNAWLYFQILQTIANTLYYTFICIAFFTSYYKYKRRALV